MGMCSVCVIRVEVIGVADVDLCGGTVGVEVSSCCDGVEVSTDIGIKVSTGV